MKITADYITVAARDARLATTYSAVLMPGTHRIDKPTTRHWTRQQYLPQIPAFRAYAQMCLSFSAYDNQPDSITPSMYKALAGDPQTYHTTLPATTEVR